MKPILFGGLVFVVFEYFAYQTFVGEVIEVRRKTDFIGSVIGWLIETIGRAPSSVVIAILGVVLGYFVYNRMKRLAG